MPRGPEIADFAEKLRLALVRANLSRAQLAQAVGVDKSVVARWLNGALHPSDHTLTVLTGALARTIGEFARADWDKAAASFAARLGLPEGSSPVLSRGGELMTPDRHDAIAVARLRMAGAFEAAESAYSGLWLFLLPSQHDRGAQEPVGCSAARIRPACDSVTLQFELGLWEKVTARGTVLVLQDHVYFVMSSERQHGLALLFCIFNGVSHGRAAVLDGMSMTTELVGEMAQHAYRVVGFRVSDATDDAAFAGVLRRTARLTQGEMDAVVPAPIAAAFAAPVMTTRSPSRIRLPRRESWTCQEEFLSRQAYAEQREALKAVRTLFAEALGETGHA